MLDAMKSLVTLIFGFFVAGFILVKAFEEAESTEMQWINSEVSLFKQARNTRYVDIKDPEYIAILDKGEVIFKREVVSNIKSRVPFFVLLAALVACVLFHLNRGKTH